MANRPKNVYVIAGANGSGKTTFAKTFLPQFAECNEFVNVDLIATGLSPFSPETAALRAGRLVLTRLRQLTEDNMSFGFETTLSGKTYLNFLKILRKKGYSIWGIYLWLPNEDLAVQRVRDRVRLGGHNVPEPDIRRRFTRGLHHFLADYQRFWSTWMLFDNSQEIPNRIAYGDGAHKKVEHPSQFRDILKQAGLDENF